MDENGLVIVPYQAAYFPSLQEELQGLYQDPGQTVVKP